MKTSKLLQIDQKIDDTQSKIAENKEELVVFKEKAIADVENFQKKKVGDLKDTLESYIQLQIKMARKGVQTWSNIKDCINSIPT